MCVGGRVVAKELDRGKVMVIKVLLRDTSFSDLLLTQKCHHCIHSEEKKKELDVSKFLSNRTCLTIIFN